MSLLETFVINDLVTYQIHVDIFGNETQSNEVEGPLGAPGFT